MNDKRTPPRRVILLGASNVALALPAVMKAAFRVWGRPLDVLAAFGHGRSYGQRRALLWRELPGIAECGLWQALEQRQPAPTAALVTDIGNDLLYEAPVTEILGWVDACLDRLQRVEAQVVLTPLPLCSIVTLSKAKYLLLRSILYPACRLAYATVLGRAFDLDERLRALARQRAVRVAEPRPEWYGFDKIHIHRRARLAAWGEILASWSSQPRVTATMPAGSFPLRPWLLAPERRWIFGRERHTAQPAGKFPDGTTLALY